MVVIKEVLEGKLGGNGLCPNVRFCLKSGGHDWWVCHHKLAARFSKRSFLPSPFGP